MPSLPPEIIGEIALTLSGRDKIHQCPLVSRTFRDIFEPRLYDGLVFIYGEAPSVHDAITRGGTIVPVRNTPLLLRTISERPELVEHTKLLSLSLYGILDDEHLPKLLTSLPNLQRFDLAGSMNQGQEWSFLDTEARDAITTVCQLPALRSLFLSGFMALPSTLLCTNHRLDCLVVWYVSLFTKGDPGADIVEDFNLNREQAQLPLIHFRGLRKIECAYYPIFNKHQWLATAIKSASESASLRILSLVVTSSENWGLFESTGPFGEPFDLALAQNLTLMKLKGVGCKACPDDELAMDFFTSFCQFANTTVATVQESAALETLVLSYDARRNNEFFQLPIVEAIPDWKQLWRTVGDKRFRKHLKLRQVSFDISFDPIPQEFRPSVAASIKEHMLRLAPDVDVTVSFLHPSQVAPV